LNISNTSLPRTALEAYLLFWVSLELVLTVGLAAQMISIPIGLAVTELITILLPAVLFVRMGKLPLRAAFRVKPVSGKIIFCSVVLGVSSFPLGLAADTLTEPLVNAAFGHAPDFAWLTTRLPQSWTDLLWWLPVGALLPGVCEEILFRGAIQGTLERKGTVKAVIITAFLFALFHLNPWNFAVPLLLGLAFGFATIHSNSIIPAMVWHTMVNAMAFTAGVIYKNKTDNLPPWWVMLLSAIVFAAAGVWFLRLTRNNVREPSPLAFSAGIEVARVRRLAKFAGYGLALLIVGCFTCFAVSPVATDQLSPEIPRGSIALMLRNRFEMVSLKPGDVITFRKEGKLFIRRVTRVSENEVWISEKSDDGKIVEREISMSEVAGKCIKHFDLPHSEKN
jgi:membrane protease YdiL (CAAX protease family)